MDNSYNEITIPDIKIPDQSQGLNNAPIEDTQLQVWNNREISGMQYFAMDIFSSSGSTGDGTFRDINLIGFNWDKWKSYTQEIITALGNTTAAITKTYTIDTPVNNVFKLPAWKIFKISAYFNSATQNLRIADTGTRRYIRAWATPLDLTSNNPELVFINNWTTTSSINLKFATSAADRPIFWFLIEIK